MSVAEQSAARMWADDRAAQSLGMEIRAVDTGAATLTMPVRQDMANGHGIVHGGFIFALADTAFAYACNSSGQRAVAHQCQISYVAPARIGDTLTAVATEFFKEGRQGITDVVVTTEAGTTVAHFRGHSRTIAGSLITETPGTKNA